MKGKIIISIDSCKGCLFCVVACPNKLIKESTQLNAKGYYPARFDDTLEDTCTACTLCAISCPEAAIEVYRGEK